MNPTQGLEVLTTRTGDQATEVSKGRIVGETAKDLNRDLPTSLVYIPAA